MASVWDQFERAPAPGASTSSPLDNLSGPDLLAALERPEANTVLAIAQGREELPGGLGMGKPYVQRLRELVTQFDPSFNAQNAGARAALLRSFKSGKDADSIVAINTVADHVNKLSHAVDALDNSRFPLWNSIANTAESAVGDSRVNRFNLARKAVLDEMAKAYRGGVLSDSEIRGWGEGLNSAQSPEQMYGALGMMADLLQSKIAALGHKYHDNMGPYAPPIAEVGEHAKTAFEDLPRQFEAIRAKQHGESGAGPAASASAPMGATVAPGKYTWDPQRGLIPAK